MAADPSSRPAQTGSASRLISTVALDACLFGTDLPLPGPKLRAVEVLIPLGSGHCRTPKESKWSENYGTLGRHLAYQASRALAPTAPAGPATSRYRCSLSATPSGLLVLLRQFLGLRGLLLSVLLRLLPLLRPLFLFLWKLALMQFFDALLRRFMACFRFLDLGNRLFYALELLSFF